LAERHDPFAALRQRNFLLFSGARAASTMAQQMLNAAVFWQVYEITGSASWLAAVGLVRLIPHLMTGLIAGAVADRYNRRRVMLISQSIQLSAMATLAAVTVGGNDSVWPIFACVFVIALAGAFEWPARQALLPMLVTAETFPNAIIVSGTVQQAAFVTGPAVGAGLIAASGVGLAYSSVAVLVVASILLVTTLRPREGDAPKRAVSVAAIAEGVRFVFHRQPVLGSMTLDMFAVIFGGATALLPIYAKEILDVGAIGYGFLFAAVDAGALLMSVVVIFMPPIQRVGRALLWAVLAFGIATMAFGLSRWFPLSLAALFAVGAADQISVVMRQTTIQLATPDELRGRVTAVNMLFIGTSNQLGQVESGLVAALTNATFAVVSGGAGCLAVLGVVAAKMPELRHYRLQPAPNLREQELEAGATEELASAAGGS